jgi:hypothetical protein
MHWYKGAKDRASCGMAVDSPISSIALTHPLSSEDDALDHAAFDSFVSAVIQHGGADIGPKQTLMLLANYFMYYSQYLHCFMTTLSAI